jgi:hypothetical protein
MKNVVKQYSFIEKDMVSIKYSNWFRGVKVGSSNGLNDLKNMGLTVSKTKAVPQRESGEKLPSIWSKRSSLSGQSWKLTRPDDLSLLVLEQRLSIGSLNRERFVMFHLSPRLPISSLVMERPVELKTKEIAIVSPILTLKQKRWETFIKQIWLDQGISEVQGELPDSIPFTLLMWQDTQHLPVSLLVSRLSPFVGISLKHGDLWGFQRYLRWITRWLPQVEVVILIAFLRLYAFICFWEFILYSSRKENQEEMPLSKVLINSGRRESLEDMIVLPLLPLKGQVSDSCNITIMRNHIEVLPKKNTAQNSLAYSETASGSPSDICQRVLPLKDILTPMGILISLLQKGKSPLSEKLTPMEELTSMELLISSGRNLRGSMLLPLSLLIERDWLLNKTIGLSNLSLSRLRGIVSFHYSQLQGGKLNSVHDVIIFLSIKNQFTML